MPVRRFWSMNANINRISAERDMRLLTVMNSAQSAEGAKETREHLVKELGDVVKAKADEKLDREGLEWLRNL